jgi:hypothetical protein
MTKTKCVMPPFLQAAREVLGPAASAAREECWRLFGNVVGQQQQVLAPEEAQQEGMLQPGALDVWGDEVCACELHLFCSLFLRQAGSNLVANVCVCACFV